MESRRPRASAFIVALAMCVVLGTGLLYRHNTAMAQRDALVGRINQLSNAWQEASLKLDEQKWVNSVLEQEVPLPGSESAGPAIVSAATVKSGARHGAKVEPVRPDPEVAKLQSERDSLCAEVDDLTANLAKLDADMAATRAKLATSEGDRTDLWRELRRLEVDRAALLAQFNNLARVREQLRKLKAEQAVNRRLAWIRRGVFGSNKGAELLRKGLVSTPPAAPDYDLDVELRRNQEGRGVNEDR